LPHHQFLFAEKGIDAKIVYAAEWHWKFVSPYLNTIAAVGFKLQTEPPAREDILAQEST
jgi:hypothetical protein